MAKRPDYTTRAITYTARFPLLTYLGTQVNFWIIANVLLVSIMHLTAIVIGQTFNVSVAGDYLHMLPMAIVLGISYGIIIGLISYYLDQRVFSKLALGKIIVLKAATSLGVLILLLLLLRYVFFDLLIAPTLPPDAVIDKDESWNVIFWLLMMYYSFVTLIISFINQVNKKYGPGVLIPLLLGQYRNPKEDERIFMFMDLKSSTNIAEKLGHLQYSAFIRDCFADINEVLFPHQAQVYQYVGDEIVVMWPESEGFQHHHCVRFYFACKKQFQNRAEYYRKNYGIVPAFKAGVHSGKVTAVEIGQVKRDIAYHGDTLNTAARIQSVCNEHNKDFLISEYVIGKIGPHPQMKTESLGMILLRGKTEKVGVVSVEWKG
ncbi:MAG TPA: adenylate/guanylate cyclase domain-containing protein [Cyclobacteriaceae bacterium]|nr:adenylate/guanylate cyclase domain-containing protein [Cyclobacteriaceae bacterium]